MTGRYCGACGANVLQPSQQTMHPALDDAHILCGLTGKRTLTYLTPPVEDVPSSGQGEGDDE